MKVARVRVRPLFEVTDVVPTAVSPGLSQLCNHAGWLIPNDGVTIVRSFDRMIGSSGLVELGRHLSLILLLRTAPLRVDCFA